MATLRAAGDVQETGSTVFLAELGLDGRLRPIRGILPAVLASVKAGHHRIVVARANVPEAALVPGASVEGFDSLAQVALAFGADPAELLLEPLPEVGVASAQEEVLGGLDLADVAGQSEARAALEVAAAGRHHLLLVGPPGAGKTMLAERMPGLLPDLSDDQAMEVTAIHSLGGFGESRARLIRRPPFENPHHTASTASIVGGGSGMPRPGAASRAHHGVLFLDEAPEYDRRVLDALRQPLESGELVIHRSAGIAAYPARFQLMLAANPCPCGGSGGKALDCSCTSLARRRYFGKLSGPLLDRVDIQLSVHRLSLAQLASQSCGEATAVVADRVIAARAQAGLRLAPFDLSVNAEVPGQVLRGPLRLPAAVTTVLDRALERGSLTARGYDRVLRLAWTLADLADVATPDADHIGQALTMRNRGGGQ